MTQHNSKKGFAIASLVVSLVGLVAFGFIMGVLGVIFGGIAWKESGLAKAGVVIGIFDIVAIVLYMSQF